jgi:hypothetical protein
MRMAFIRGFSILMLTLSLSGCSKLADYSLDVATPTPVPSPSVSVSVPSAIHEWDFENNGNDTGSIGGWPGTLSVGTYTTTAGEFKVGSYAAKFSSAGEFSLGAQALPDQMTISCWVKWLSGGGPNTIIANSAFGAIQSGIRFYVQTTGQLTLETGNNTSGVAVNSVTLLTSGTYTHVVAEFDNVLNQSAIYVNGALDQSGAVESGYGLGSSVSLGAIPGATDSFNGELDDCRIFNVALSSQQVTILYNSY